MESKPVKKLVNFIKKEMSSKDKTVKEVFLKPHKKSYHYEEKMIAKKQFETSLKKELGLELETKIRKIIRKMFGN